MQMQSWSDHGLGVIISWSIILGIVGAVLVFVSVALTYLATAEQFRRASENEALAREQDALLSTSLEEEEEKVAKEQSAADEAKQRAKAAEDEKEPRSITAEQSHLFVSELEEIPKGGVTVVVFSQDAEIKQYAEQIREMLLAAGFDVGFVKTDTDSDWSPAGIILSVKDATIQPRFAVPLQHAFSGIGIHTEGIIDASIEDTDTLHIVVGSR